MGTKQLLLMAVLLIAALMAACGPDPTPTPVALTAGAAAPTPFVSGAQGRVAQPTAYPSLTPLGAPQNSAPYGSVQVNAEGVIVATSVAGSPLLYSAQAVEEQPNVTPNGTPNLTPGAVVTVVVTVPPPTPTMVDRSVTVQPIESDSGGLIVNAINALCIPLINLVLNATIGLVQSVWNAVGAQTSAVGQAGLCIGAPAVVIWFFWRRRRKRRNR